MTTILRLTPETHCTRCRHSKHPSGGASTPGDLQCRLSGLERVSTVFLKLSGRNGFNNLDRKVRCEFQPEVQPPTMSYERLRKHP